MRCLAFNFRCYSSAVSKLAYDQYGVASDKVPLVIGHGLFGSRRNWRSLAKSLQRKLGCAVYAIDFRNHGDSPHHDEHSFPAMADDLSEFLENVKSDTRAPSFNLLGHSMGGIVMSHYALNFLNADAMISKLIIEDIAPNRTISGSSIPRFVKAMKMVNLSKSRREIEEALKPDVPNDAIRQFLLMNLVKKEGSNERWRWQVNLDAIERSFNHVFTFSASSGQFSKPTLFLAGGNSPYIQPEDREVLSKMFLNSSFETIPNAGHWVHADQPESFVNVVTKFLS